jgi:hypothetical protein
VAFREQAASSVSDLLSSPRDSSTQMASRIPPLPASPGRILVAPARTSAQPASPSLTAPSPGEARYEPVCLCLPVSAAVCFHA